MVCYRVPGFLDLVDSMSASEKLKERQVEIDKKGLSRGVRFVIGALPEIIAVVEAAELWAEGSGAIRQYRSLRDHRELTKATLAALDAALTAGGSE